MCYHDDSYVKFQDLYILMRAQRKSGVPPTMETLIAWEKQMKILDGLQRERIFTLTVAAEEGWKTAQEMNFLKRGNASDKDLAKVLR